MLGLGDIVSQENSFKATVKSVVFCPLPGAARPATLFCNEV